MTSLSRSLNNMKHLTNHLITRSTFRIKPIAFLSSQTSRTFVTSPPPVIERSNIEQSRSKYSENDTNAQKLSRRTYYLSLAISGFLILDYLQSSVAAGASLYNAEEMRQLHKQIMSGSTTSTTNNTNDALRADILALTESHNRHYDALAKEIAALRAELDGRPVLKPHDHLTTWNLLNDANKPPKRE